MLHLDDDLNQTLHKYILKKSKSFLEKYHQALGEDAQNELAYYEAPGAWHLEYNDDGVCQGMNRLWLHGLKQEDKLDTDNIEYLINCINSLNLVEKLSVERIRYLQKNTGTIHKNPNHEDYHDLQALRSAEWLISQIQFYQEPVYYIHGSSLDYPSHSFLKNKDNSTEYQFCALSGIFTQEDLIKTLENCLSPRTSYKISILLHDMGLYMDKNGKIYFFDINFKLNQLSLFKNLSISINSPEEAAIIIYDHIASQDKYRECAYDLKSNTICLGITGYSNALSPISPKEREKWLSFIENKYREYDIEWLKKSLLASITCEDKIAIKKILSLLDKSEFTNQELYQLISQCIISGHTEHYKIIEQKFGSLVHDCINFDILNLSMNYHNTIYSDRFFEILENKNMLTPNLTISYIKFSLEQYIQDLHHGTIYNSKFKFSGKKELILQTALDWFNNFDELTTKRGNDFSNVHKKALKDGRLGYLFKKWLVCKKELSTQKMCSKINK